MRIPLGLCFVFGHFFCISIVIASFDCVCLFVVHKIKSNQIFICVSQFVCVSPFVRVSLSVWESVFLCLRASPEKG